MTERRRSRHLAALAAAAGALLLLAVASTPVEQTEAAWVDRENVRVNLSTLTVPPPVLGPVCTTNPGLLGATPSITVDWTLPAGYTLASARYAAGLTLGAMQPQPTTGYTTTTTSPGNYRTVFSGGLLAGLLGGQASVGISVAHSTSAWTSKWASATGGSAILGINPYCAVNP